MAGIFSLGNGGGESNREASNNIIHPWSSTSASGNGMVLYRNDEIYQKGFEIWQQYVQFHQHHSPAAAMGAAGSGSPAVTSARCVVRSGVGSGGVNCQDCGNQAKKDCEHLRCRSCCKSRGFECATHVKSTWVPAATRRERQQRRLRASSSSSSQPMKIEIGGGGEGDSQMRQKRQRDNTNSRGLELGQHFPAELSSTAVFRCMRVHATDDVDEQLAYQTAINIGGRLFKGILYDQGPVSLHQTHQAPPDSKDSSANLMNGATSNSATANHHENPSLGATLVDSNAMYSPPISSFLAGMQFFPNPGS